MYFYKCLEYLVEIDENIIVDIYVQGIDSDSPYRFLPDNERLRITEYHNKSYAEVINKNPAMVYCAGWGNGEYLKLVKELKSSGIITICGLDNPWIGDLQQRIKTIFFSGYIRKHFNFIWSAGHSQKVFAQKMGFTDDKILDNLYVGNVSEYKVSEEELDIKSVNYPKKLIYFGRLVPYKHVVMLAEVFLSLDSADRNGWQLEIVGRGPENEKLLKLSNENIKMLDFMQPEKLAEYVKSVGAYVLPSNIEHWGVAVHEAALSGLPIIASDGVKAAEVFVENNKNGFLFRSESKTEMKKSLLSLFSMGDLDLLNFSKHSLLLSKRVTYSSWRDNLMKVFN